MQSLFVANWKMNLSAEGIKSYAQHFKTDFQALKSDIVDVVFAPPFPYLGITHDYLALTIGVALGAQNIHWQESGAHTGEVSASMLKDFSVEYAIVGHSERRQFYGENNLAVSKRAKAALLNGIKPIVCVGEKEFSSSSATTEVISQLKLSLQEISDSEISDNLIIAYEPIWAIGTGKSATPEIISNIHAQIRAELQKLFPTNGCKIRILYGGSTSAENITEIMTLTEVHGALVGGASLKPDSFIKLIENGRKVKGLA